jgi:acyl dehydratase
MRYFEDVAVGDTASFGHYRVDRDEAIDFARRYDPQPFHLSDEAAAQTHFGRLSASGWHTCAMTMAMVVEGIKERQEASLGSPGIDELRWLKPVYPGDTLTCHTEVIDTRASASRPEMGFIKTRITVSNQDAQPVLRFIATSMLATRPLE